MKANKHEINGYIYITSDGHINDEEIHLCTKYKELHSHKHRNNTDTCKKIILCNNPNLPIQQLSTEEVEYLKSVDSFEVEKIFKANPKYEEDKQFTENVGFWNYKIIIPQETEQPKESIEEVVLYFKKVKPNNSEQEESIRQIFIDETKEYLWAHEKGDCGFSEDYVFWLEKKIS